MSSVDQQTVSFWSAEPIDLSAPMLRDDTTADVCVLGGGIAGLTTAYLLGKENVLVVVLDAGLPAESETARTTAHLSNAFDDRYYNLLRWHGAPGARLAAESHTAAIDLIERIAREEAIDCGFKRVDGFLFCAETDEPEMLAEEGDAAHRAGLPGVELVDLPALAAPGGKALRFPRQGQFDPLRYLAGLREAIVAQGGRIFSQSRVVDVDEGSGDETVVTCENGAKVTARSLVVATNSPINDRFALQTKVYPYRTYALAATAPAGSVPAGLYWDTADPYHYVRLTHENDATITLIIGGEDHKTGQADDTGESFRRLEAWSRQRFPSITAVTHRWSGQVNETIDGLAYIGRNPGSPDNVYVTTGDSGMGMTHGTISGMIIADLIQGRTNAWAHLYSPSRVVLGGALEFARENFNVARQYLDWAKPGARDDATDIAPGEGKVVRRGLHKIALYRTPEGGVCELSATCPHLGCVVAWNPTEHTWDCPCHGSRFEGTGGVIHGPALSSLAPVEPKENAVSRRA